MIHVLTILAVVGALVSVTGALVYAIGVLIVLRSNR